MSQIYSLTGDFLTHYEWLVIRLDYVRTRTKCERNYYCLQQMLKYSIFFCLYLCNILFWSHLFSVYCITCCCIRTWCPHRCNDLVLKPTESLRWEHVYHETQWSLSRNWCFKHRHANYIWPVFAFQEIVPFQVICNFLHSHLNESPTRRTLKKRPKWVKGPICNNCMFSNEYCSPSSE